MESKDTVMTTNDFLDWLRGHNIPSWNYNSGELNREAQSEISFKAGYNEGKKDGIKEVVEFINNNSIVVRSMDEILWKSKLKEWRK